MFFKIKTFNVLFLLCLMPGIALAAEQGGTTSMVMASLKMLWGLLIVLGLIFALYALAKKKFAFLPNENDTSVIQIKATRHLQPKKALYLVEVRGEEFLLGLSGEQLNLIAPIGNGRTGSKHKENFSEILKESSGDIEK